MKIEPKLQRLLPKKEEPKAAAPPTAAPKSEESAEKPKSKAVGSNTKILDKMTVEKAAQMASQEANSQVLKSIPKTAAGFEKDFNQLRKDSSMVFQYIKKIPTKTVE